MAKIVPAGGLDGYRVIALGDVSLGAAAEHNLELKSHGKTWGEVRLRRVRLVPAAVNYRCKGVAGVSF